MDTRTQAKKLKLEKAFRSHGKYSIDSFDRFGDDLCEHLLSYLSISDKFRYECVSKQWKSLIFNKEFVLSIDFNSEFDFLVYNNKNKYHYLNEQVFETVVKKCLFIKKLKLSIGMMFKDNGSIFELMANNCRYLEKFSFRFYAKYMCEDIYFDDKINEFGDKCGPKLKSIDIKCVEMNERVMKQLLRKTTNVTKVGFNNISVFIHSNDDTFLQNLVEVKFNDYNYDELKVFADRYHKQLKRIRLEVINSYDPNPKNISSRELNGVLIQLSRFENMEKLMFGFEVYDNSVQVFIDEGLQMIANECKKLKDFKFQINSQNASKDETNMKLFKSNLFSNLAHFRSLNSLEIELMGFNVNLGQMKSLSNIKNLSKLSFKSIKLKDDHFIGIHLYLPHLTSLVINYIPVTDKTLSHLMKLPKLSTLRLSFTGCTDNGLKDFLSEASVVKHLIFDSTLFRFNDAILQTFIKFAKRRPQVMHKFSFDLNDDEEEGNPEIPQLPKNLIIDVVYID